ncbi:MAG: hypothetical protein M3N33_00870 [Actinomycetota bacterium]|nr:hypothetical protein [Actinomycetota bacterium]
MTQTIEDLKQQLEQTRAEYQNAKSAARRERAEAATDGRRPKKATVDAPAKIRERLDQLPYDIYAAEVKSIQAQKAALEDRVAEAEKEVPDIVAALESARQKVAEGQRELKEAEAARDKNSRNRSRMQIRDLDKRLAVLYERGPEGVED